MRDLAKNARSRPKCEISQKMRGLAWNARSRKKCEISHKFSAILREQFEINARLMREWCENWCCPYYTFFLESNEKCCQKGRISPQWKRSHLIDFWQKSNHEDDRDALWTHFTCVNNIAICCVINDANHSKHEKQRIILSTVLINAW